MKTTVATRRSFRRLALILFSPLRNAVLFVAWWSLALAATPPADLDFEQTNTSESSARPSHSGWDFFQFIDRLPGPLADRLSDDQPGGALRLHLRPHFGDLIHRDYLRVPAGAQFKINDHLEVSSEVEGYFTHGLGAAAGYGFSTLRLGSKCEHVLSRFGDGGISTGFNYQTPLSRPPQDLTDGHRHLQPYVSISRPLQSNWRILSYSSLSADFLQHTAMPPHFGRNELHANSLTFSTGVARDWPRFHAACTVSMASTALMSNEARQVVALRPEIAFPLWSDRVPTQVLLTLGGRVVRGPDGTEVGINSSVRFEFEYHGRRRTL